MEHEAYVPVPAERLREALADPELIARAVPGLQQDAGAEPVTGRLKLRVGGHSITYRGTVRVSARDDGSYDAHIDASETRGTGAVKLVLTLRLREAEGGCTLAFTGSATADGRITELPPDAVTSALTRLLSRFAGQLGTVAETAPDQADQPEDHHGDDDLPPPPPPLPEAPEEPAPQPAEAAHARRTMIGRSAEEVDHAPPRGRYAPVPAPQTVTPNQTLRWAAPAAALALASAIAVGRALRRRH